MAKEVLEEKKRKDKANYMIEGSYAQFQIKESNAGDLELIPGSGISQRRI